MTRRSFFIIWHIRYKHRFKQQLKEIAVLAAVLFFFGIILSITAFFSNILILDTPLLQTVINNTLPGIRKMDIALGREEEPQVGLLASLLFTFTEGGFLSAKSIVAESLPAFSLVPIEEKASIPPVERSANRAIAEAATSKLDNLSGPKDLASKNLPEIKQDDRRGNVEIVIYNTHSSEAYHGLIEGDHKKEALDYCFGRWHEDAGVIGVANELNNELRKLGVGTYRISKIHDGNVFRLAYVYSEESVKEALKRFKDTKLVLDIHRDAAVDEPFRLVINGQYAAQVAIVVATGERSSRTWDQAKNRAIARELITLINQRYPGLCRGAIYKTGAYNQHLHPGSLVIEIGNDCNTDAEAQYTARLLAPILKDLLQGVL